MRRRVAIMLGAVMALSGCAGGALGERPPLTPATLEGDAIAGPEARLQLSHFPAVNPKAVILALHGYGDYGEATYQRAAAQWAAQGIETFALDQRGHGRNPRWREWPGAGTLIADLEAAFAALRAARPDLPIYVAGNSMGGGVVLAALGERRLEGAAGGVLLAPAVWGGDRLNPIFRASAWLAALVAPEKRWTGRGVVRIQPTDNIPMLRALVKDPLHYAAPSGREFMGLIRLMDRAVAATGDVDAPVLVVMGAKDEVIPEASVRAAYDDLPGPKDWRRVETAWHMLLRDLEAERVWDAVGAWVLEQTE